MAVINLDAAQFVRTILVDRYVVIPIVDYTALAVALECSWFDWGSSYEATQTAFYAGTGIDILRETSFNEWSGRFTPRNYLAFRWTGLPDGAAWRSTATVTFRQSVTVAGLHDVPQVVSLYLLREYALPAFSSEDGVAPPTDPNLMQRILLARNVHDAGFPLGDRDEVFTFAPDAVNEVMRNSAWNGTLGLLLTTQCIPLNTENPNTETAMFLVHSPASLPGTPTARITVDQVDMPFYQGRSYRGRASSRFDACPKCGQVSLRETWVRDGLTMRLVDPKCYDPPIPRRRPPMPVRPGVNDGG